MKLQSSVRSTIFTGIPRARASADRARSSTSGASAPMAKPGADGAVGFEVFAGGGLGRTPAIGIRLRECLPERELLAYMEAILRVYNAYGRRDNLYKARLKILVQALGRESLAEKVEAEFAAIPKEGYRLGPDNVEAIPARFGKPHLDAPVDAPAELSKHRRRDPAFDLWVQTNSHPHRAAGYISVVLSLKPRAGIPGDASAMQMDAIADLAERFSSGEIRVTHLQNLVLGHVRQDELYTLWQTLGPLGLDTPNRGLITDVVCCPGLDYCALANARSIPIAQRTSERFADIELQEQIGRLRVNISGCINACGHHHNADIGILGVDKKGEEFFQLTFSGCAEEDAAIGQTIGTALPEGEAVNAISRVIDTYLARRVPNERFRNTYRRLGATFFKEAAYAAA
jgi:sulfite reductase (NADPH) hemoprotein beta-component